MQLKIPRSMNIYRTSTVGVCDRSFSSSSNGIVRLELGAGLSRCATLKYFRYFGLLVVMQASMRVSLETLR